jgi:hypothetical protein
MHGNPQGEKALLEKVKCLTSLSHLPFKIFSRKMRRWHNGCGQVARAPLPITGGYQAKEQANYQAENRRRYQAAYLQKSLQSLGFSAARCAQQKNCVRVVGTQRQF